MATVLKAHFCADSGLQKGIPNKMEDTREEGETALLLLSFVLCITVTLVLKPNQWQRPVLVSITLALVKEIAYFFSGSITISSSLHIPDLWCSEVEIPADPIQYQHWGNCSNREFIQVLKSKIFMVSRTAPANTVEDTQVLETDPRPINVRQTSPIPVDSLRSSFVGMAML
eukprot:Gb_23762 [translate_table: standard]